MPDIGGNAPKRRSLNLSDSTKDTQSGRSGGRKGSPAPPPKKRQPEPAPRQSRNQITFEGGDDDDEMEEDDEIIQASLNQKKKSPDTKTVALLGAALVVVVIIAFVMFSGKKDPEPDAPPPTGTEQAQPSTPPAQDPLTPGNTGIQDFTGNTNNTSDSPLTNPDGFVQDINGLTMRVEYDVTAITDQVDFVNYVKKRGTWGGGLELYWLDCTYHDTQYVIQVPFKYYKELTDTGIVPVKMEVLQVKQPTGEVMYVVSYMALDEPTLQVFLKNSKK